MAFVNGTYTSNALGGYKIRVSEDKAGLAGVEEGVGTITDSNVEAIASEGGRKKHGIHARGVRGSRTVGVGDEAFKKYVFIPCATVAIQDALLTANTFTYKTLIYTSLTSVAEK